MSNRAYDYATPLIGGLRWSYFNPEAQAELVSDLWDKGYFKIKNNGFASCKPGLIISANLYSLHNRTTKRFTKDRSSRVDVFLSCLRRGKGAAYSNTTTVSFYVKWDKHGQVIDLYD